MARKGSRVRYRPVRMCIFVVELQAVDPSLNDANPSCKDTHPIVRDNSEDDRHGAVALLRGFCSVTCGSDDCC